MDIMIPIIIGSISATAVFTIIYFFLYLQNRERYIAYWTWALFIHLLGLVPLLVLFISQNRSVLSFGILALIHINDLILFALHVLTVFITSLLLLIGSCHFFNRPINKPITYVTIAAGIFNITGTLLLLPFYFYSIPSSIVAASLYIFHGRMFLLNNVRSIAGWFLVMFGIHLLDYPFLLPFGNALPWGYLIANSLVVGISAGILIHYFENKNSKLAQSETRFQELADSLPDVVFESNPQGKLTYVNKNAYAFFRATREDNVQGANALDYIAPEDRARGIENIQKIMMGMDSGSNEYIGLRKDGTRFPIIIRSTPILRDGKAVGIRGFIIDITDRKNTEMQMQYLSYHDYLTGLLNRHGLKHEIEKLLETNNNRVGIIVCDVDGLKLVNDTMGHDVGDTLLKTVAALIKETTRAGDITARVGGDEFCILIPLTEDDIVPNTVKRLRKGIETNNMLNPELPISISIGYVMSSDSKFNIQSLFKEADDYMYRQKLHYDNSNRSTIVQTLMKALKARDFITEGHADRLQQLVCDIASAIGFPERHIVDLRLLAQFHDIGKVGIPDSILFKPGPLNFDEKKEMERHCEIGYRIARSSPELALIAELILKHHEWWNGQGYPLKLKEDEIPLECRILAIADAYDAMTSDRPYRKAMSHFEAMVELKRHTGVQFDPFIVSEFIKIVGNGYRS